MPKLLEQARDAIRVRQHSIGTEESYLRWMKHFILFHNKRHPATACLLPFSSNPLSGCAIESP